MKQSVWDFDIFKSELSLCSYVQWVESGGARVVPVVIGRSEHYYNQVIPVRDTYQHSMSLHYYKIFLSFYLKVKHFSL